MAQAGSEPYANDGTKIELHHLLQQEPGPMVEIPASLHDKYYKTLHGLAGDGENFRNIPDLEKQYNILELNIGDGEQKICIRGFMNVERVRGIYTE